MRLFRERVDPQLPTLRVTIDKRIPVAAGLGMAEARRAVELAADLHDHVRRVGVDRHPLAGPGLAPARELARGERGVERPGGV